MSYYVAGNRRRPALGLSAEQTAFASAGANVIVPGSGPIVAVGAGILDSLFGGARDKARLAREQWFEQAAKQGSTLAARFLIGGTMNTSGNERPYYEAGIARLLADPRAAPTMRAAQAAGPWWDATDNATSDKSRAAVESELLAMNAQRSTTSVPGTQSLPASTSGTTNGAPYMSPAGAREPFNWKPWAIGAAGVGLALFVLPQITQPSRSSRRR